MFRKRLLLAFTVTAVTAAGWAIWVNACDQDKQTSAQAANGRGAKTTAVTAGAGKGNCSAAMAAQCTAAMAAECKAHGANATTGSMSECPHHSAATTASMAGHEGCATKATAATASMAGHEGCATKAAATTASMAGHEGCATKATAATASHDGCSMKATTATAGMNGEGHGVSATTASMGGGHDCCAGKSAKGATAVKAGSACDSRMMGAGMIGAPSCSNLGMSAATAEMEGDCDACAEMVNCSGRLTANGVQTQVVPLKNGVMFVYTTDTAAHVRGVQNAMARRNDQLNTLAQAGDRAKLCPQCKTARGAIASGKLTRETVNIEGGCMTLVTSSDPATVAKLRMMATMSNGRTKS